MMCPSNARFDDVLHCIVSYCVVCSRFAAVREQEAIVDKLKDQVREQEALRAQITRLEEDLAKKPTEVTSTPLESQQPTASPASKYVLWSERGGDGDNMRTRFLRMDWTVVAALIVL